jgi:2-polyprenyl-3-methyl-5-hydroxy-6-metoxy-1,4-benzoquinol methylase
MRKNRNDEIDLYVEAYKDEGYKMGVRRTLDVYKILSGLPKTSLLDVGTGRGETLDMATGKGFKHVMGTEVVEYLTNERVVYAQSIDLPFDDNSFDTVTCFDVMEHLIEEDLVPTIKEFCRVAISSVIVSCSEEPSVYDGVDLHISSRPKDQWLNLIKAASGCHVECIGTAGKSPAFRIWI